LMHVIACPWNMLVPSVSATQFQRKRPLPPCKRGWRPAKISAAFAVVAAVASAIATPSFVVQTFPGASIRVHDRHTALTALTSLLARPVGYFNGRRSGTRSQQSHHGILATAATVEGASDATPGTGIKFWLDFRQERAARASGKLTFTSLKVSEDWNPSIVSAMKDLRSGLQEKLKIIGVTDLSDKVISAALVDEEKVDAIIQEVKDLDISVYTACRELDGLKLPGGASWVCDATSKEVIGGLAAPPVQLSQTAGLTALDVWAITPKSEEPQEKSAKAEEFEKLCELFDVPDDDKDALPVQPGQTLAKAFPQDPLLWARAIMQKRKESGAGSSAYR